jgi:hypothetical protein
MAKIQNNVKKVFVFLKKKSVFQIFTPKAPLDTFVRVWNIRSPTKVTLRPFYDRGKTDFFAGGLVIRNKVRARVPGYRFP